MSYDVKSLMAHSITNQFDTLTTTHPEAAHSLTLAAEEHAGSVISTLKATTPWPELSEMQSEKHSLNGKLGMAATEILMLGAFQKKIERDYIEGMMQRDMWDNIDKMQWLEMSTAGDNPYCSKRCETCRGVLCISTCGGCECRHCCYGA